MPDTDSDKMPKPEPNFSPYSTVVDRLDLGYCVWPSKRIGGRQIWVLIMGLAFSFSVIATSCKPQKPQVLESDRPEIYKDTTEKAPERKPKPPKRGVYYGIKTRKAYTKVVKNKKRTFELFHVLAKPQDPSPYNLTHLHWFHKQKRKIFIGPIPDKEAKFAKILHGPYRRTFDGKTVEEGIYYMGAKHGRWENYGATTDQILNDKIKWYKGFPKESDITYYDVEQTQFKEVTPVVDGERHGEYYFFNSQGQVLIYGKYEYNRKIGIWLEYWEGTKKKTIKTKTQYPESSFVPQFEGYVMQRMDAKGNVIYDKATEEAKEKARIAAEKKATEDKAVMDRLNPPKPTPIPK